MHTSRFFLLGGLTVVGALLSVSSGCGDDGDTGSGGASSSTTTSSSSGGEGGKGGAGQGGGGDELTCEAYCTAIQANCAADEAQFGAEGACLGTCKTWDLGASADTTGDTLGCHLYHANAAKSDAATHCPHAGPAGADKCGDIVTDFCEIALSVCPDIYQTVAACKTAVGALDTTTPYNASATAGDTLACRLYHVTAASVDAAAATTHCPHIAVDSTPCK